MLSIIIPSHNRTDLLAQCLESVTRHAPRDSEIIVIDDGSSDSRVTRTAQQFPAQVIRLPRPRGFCAAVNMGIAAARHDVIELLNDDTQVMEGWTASALTWFSDAQVAAVAPLVLTGNSEIVDSAGDRYYIGGIAGKRGHRGPVTDDLRYPKKVFGASASSAFYRRDALRKIGGFPESFGSYFEDVDVAFRLGRAGYTTIYDPRSQVFHHVSSSHRQSRRLLQQQSRNEERVFWRNISSLMGTLPKHAAVLLAKAWRRWNEGTLTPYLFGRLQCWLEARSIRAHRTWLRRFAQSDCPQVESTYWAARQR